MILRLLFLLSLALFTTALQTHAAESTPAANEILIKEWKALGPFLVGPQEGGLDHLLAYGGEEAISPKAEQVFYSAFAPHAEVRWFEIKSTSSQIEIKYPAVNWDFFATQFGRLSAAGQTYLYAELSLGNDLRALISVRKVGSFFINGVFYFGETYNADFNLIPVELKKGVNRILLKVTNYGDASCDFKILRAKSPLQALNDFTTPDLVQGSPPEKFSIGIPIVNTTTDWIKNISITVEADSHFKRTITKIEFPIAPLSVMKVPITIEQSKNFASETSHPIHLHILADKTPPLEFEIPLQVKASNDDRKFTFISELDRSAQYFSAVFPKNYDPKKTYALILALHGANVEASIAASTYAPKDWAFVIAPTNRRPHGFAWQELGRLDALEVLKVAKKIFRIDENQIYLAGHSMGGQGVWHIGLHSPTLFAGLAPSAGWMSFETYTPFYLQQADRMAAPELLSIRDRVLMDTNNPAFLENGRELPIFSSQADKDDTVPAFYSRLFFKDAKAAGLNIVYREIASDKHWCDQPLNEGRGYDCVDNPKQYEFLRNEKHNKLPKKVKFKLFDLSLENSIYWLTIDRQEKIFSETTVEASIEKNEISITTQNITALSFDLPKELIPVDRVKIIWNERTFERSLSQSRKLSLELPGTSLSLRSHERYGSIKSVFFNPFAIVYGTKGSAAHTEQILHNARLLANRVWRTANGYAPILKDIDVTPDIEARYNLVLFGAPERNQITKKIMAKSPIQIRNNKIYLENKPTDATTTVFILPNPLYPKKLVAIFAGTTPSAETLSRSLRLLYDRLGTGLPDFVAFDEEIKKSAWQSFKAAGFFSNSWNLTNKDYYLK